MNFIKTKKEYLISLGIVFLVFNIALIINSGYPYGDGILLMSDAQAQIGMFFKHIIDWISGDANLFFSNKVGSGVEMLSSVEYMLLSPFFIFAFIGGKDNYLQGFNFSIVAMMLFVTFVFVWFTKKYFKNMKPYFRVILSLIYTFSTYACLNFGFITWIIYPALILFVIDAFLNLVYKQKIWQFSLFMTWYVVNCFGLGVFTNITLLVLFSAYIFIFFEKEERKPIFTRLFLGYLIAILMSVVILFPAIWGMLQSPRMSSNIRNFFDTVNNSFGNRISGLLMSASMIVLTVVYYIRCDKKEKINKFFAFSFVLLLIPILFESSLKLLNGGNYSGFASRMYFLIETLMFIVVGKLANEYKPQEENAECKTNRIYKALLFMMMTIIVIAIVCLEVFFSESLSVGLLSPLQTKSIIEFLLCYAVLISLIVIISILGKKRKVFSRKIAHFGVLFALVFVTVFNVSTITIGTGTKTDELSEATTLVNSQNINGKLKLFNAIFDDTFAANNFDFNIPETSFFSSLISNESQKAYEDLEFVSGKTILSTHTGSLISDSLMGHKYYLSSKAEHRPYLKLVDKSENYYLYENLLSTTGALLLDKDYKFNDDLTFAENMEVLKNQFEISGDLFEEANVITETAENKNKDVISFITKHTFTAEKKGILYLNQIIASVEPSEYEKKHLNGETVFYVSNESKKVKSDVCFLNAGESITFYIICDSNKIKKSELEFSFLNYDVAEEFCRELQSREAHFEFTKSGWEVISFANQKSTLVVFSPEISGYKFLNNKKAVQTSNAFSTFVSFEVEGYIKISANYKCDYTSVWIIVAAISLALIVATYLVYRKWGFAKINNIVYYAFFVINCGILSIFYILGIILTFIGLIV